MNWTVLLNFLLGFIEKNPALLENLLTALFTLLTNNPAVLNKAVTVGLAHAEAAVPKPPTV